MSFKFWFIVAACFLYTLTASGDACASSPSPQYGKNESAASSYAVNGISLYVETYGEGSPLLLIHGNGSSIGDLSNQISYFSERNLVIVADSRGHGNSGLGDGPLTYEKMSADFSQLLAHLDLGPVDILGWSDGGIIGLLLAIEHPEQVNKLAIMGANLNPRGAHDWVWPLIGSQREQVESMIASDDQTQDWARDLQLLNLLQNQPNISVESLQHIDVPTLVMAGDKDVIRNDHTMEIFENIPNAHLSIFPGATHFMPMIKPDLYNATVETFFAEPFSRPTTRRIIDPAMGGDK